jgi:hypothetical protein
LLALWKKELRREDQVFYVVVGIGSTLPNIRGRGEGKQRECIFPLSWSVHHNLAHDGYIESTCPSKIFRHGNKNTLFLCRVYSALFKNAFQA